MPPPSHSLQDGDAIRPDLDSLIGLRDTTLIALMLCTGIREAELCALDVVDLRQRLGGEPQCHQRPLQRFSDPIALAPLNH